MRKSRLGLLVNIIVLSLMVLMPSIIAEQLNESNYSPTINEGNYYPAIHELKNETVSQINKPDIFTVSVSPSVSFAEELIGEKSQASVPLKDKKIIAVETSKKQINIEPILKKILRFT